MGTAPSGAPPHHGHRPAMGTAPPWALPRHGHLLIPMSPLFKILFVIIEIESFVTWSDLPYNPLMLISTYINHWQKNRKTSLKG